MLGGFKRSKSKKQKNGKKEIKKKLKIRDMFL